jgi:sparc/osteonectin/cwcv/kazal-like domain-containing proteoglycan (testican)
MKVFAYFVHHFLVLPLGFDTSILPICKDSLGWMFNRLDTNYDLLLDQSELGSIYLDKNEQCTKAFFNSCDTYKDSLISNNEWCYCFQRQQGKDETPLDSNS